MKMLCDTSVLVASFIIEHTHYSNTIPFIAKILKKKIQGVICVHSLAECYSALSGIPTSQTISPRQAQEMVKNNVLNTFEVVALNSGDYQKAIERVAEGNYRGGMIYDALIFQAAIKNKASVLVTWNKKHFEKLSKGELKVFDPSEID